MEPDFPTASSASRGCGTRDTGLYAESGRSPFGSPLKEFLLDPVEPLPEGYNAATLANKSLVWEDVRTGICHLISWVGEQEYPHVWDIIKEIDALGASRHISSKTANLERLTPLKSRLILVHPRCRDLNWLEAEPQDTCEKQVAGHDLHGLLDERFRQGPCLYQMQSLIPASDGTQIATVKGRSFYGRTIGSTRYTYSPSDRDDKDCKEARFAVLPLTGFCFVMGKNRDPSLLESLAQAKRTLQRAKLPNYDLDLNVSH